MIMIIITTKIKKIKTTSKTKIITMIIMIINDNNDDDDNNGNNSNDNEDTDNNKNHHYYYFIIILVINILSLSVICRREFRLVVVLNPETQRTLLVRAALVELEEIPCCLTPEHTSLKPQPACTLSTHLSQGVYAGNTLHQELQSHRHSYR